MGRKGRECEGQGGEEEQEDDEVEEELERIEGKPSCLLSLFSDSIYVFVSLSSSLSPLTYPVYYIRVLKYVCIYSYICVETHSCREMCVCIKISHFDL